MLISTDAQLDEILRRDPPVAIGVSGGKDSASAAIATLSHLDALSHRGPRLLIHADLGMVEWDASLPVCKHMAAHLGIELVTVSRKAGGLMERWESRWQSSVRRYRNLETVTLVPPWSSSRSRFCTSETKTYPIMSALRKRFAGERIINVTGIRREESARRAKSAIWEHDTSGPVIHWRPILTWTKSEVFGAIAASGMELHPAYADYGMSRVSCRFCIFSSLPDLFAASAQPEAWPLYRRMVELEAESGFSFQPARWLGKVAPHLLTTAQHEALEAGITRAAARRTAEAEIQPGMLYVNGWPLRTLCDVEAAILARARQRVNKLYGFEASFLEPSEIIARYDELIALKRERDAGRRASKAVRKVRRNADRSGAGEAALWVS